MSVEKVDMAHIAAHVPDTQDSAAADALPVCSASVRGGPRHAPGGAESRGSSRRLCAVSVGASLLVPEAEAA